MESNFFKHDIDAIADPKLQRVLRERGLAGIGLYWCIIEYLYRNSGFISCEDIPTFAWHLHLDNPNLITGLLEESGLFKKTKNGYISERVSTILQENASYQQLSTSKHRKAGIASGIARAKKATASTQDEENRTSVEQVFNGNEQNVPIEKRREEIEKEIYKEKERRGHAIDAAVLAAQDESGRKALELGRKIAEGMR